MFCASCRFQRALTYHETPTQKRTYKQTKLKRDLLNDAVKLSDDPINGVVYAGYDRCVCGLMFLGWEKTCIAFWPTDTTVSHTAAPLPFFYPQKNSPFVYSNRHNEVWVKIA